MIKCAVTIFSAGTLMATLYITHPAYLAMVQVVKAWFYRRFAAE